MIDGDFKCMFHININPNKRGIKLFGEIVLVQTFVQMINQCGFLSNPVVLGYIFVEKNYDM